MSETKKNEEQEKTFEVPYLTKKQKRKRPNRKERRKNAVDIEKYIEFKDIETNLQVFDPRLHSKNKFKREQYFKEPLSRDEYVLAKFGFVFRIPPETNHKALLNPNKPIEWDEVEWVRLYQHHDDHRCSICLELPLVPKVTRCGHIFCLPCIYHYLEQSVDEYEVCPECKELITKDDLKSLKIYYTIPIKNTISLSLICRPTHSRRSYRATRMPSQLLQYKDKVPFHDESDADLCRFNITLSIHELLDEEKEALSLKLQYDDELNDVERNVFMNCIDSIEERRTLWNSYIQTYFSDTSLSLPDDATPATDPFDFFYQAEDGQPYFLHPLQSLMLAYEHKHNYVDFPKQLTAKVIDIEPLIVDDTLQHEYICCKTRARNSTIYFVEIAYRWNRKTLKQFSKELSQRRYRKRYLAQREKNQQEALAERQLKEEARREAILREIHDTRPMLPLPDMASIEAFPAVSSSTSSSSTPPKKSSWYATPINPLQDDQFPTLGSSSSKKRKKKSNKKKSTTTTTSVWGTLS